MVARYSPRQRRSSSGAKAKPRTPTKSHPSTPKKANSGGRAATPRASKSSAHKSPSAHSGSRGRRGSTSSAGESGTPTSKHSKGKGRKKKHESKESAENDEHHTAESVDFASELVQLGRSETFGRPNSILRHAMEILLRLQTESGSSAGVERHDLERMISDQMGGAVKSSVTHAIRSAVQKNLLKAKPIEREMISLSKGVIQKLMREVEEKHRAEEEAEAAGGAGHRGRHAGDEKERSESEMEEEA